MVHNVNYARRALTSATTGSSWGGGGAGLLTGDGIDGIVARWLQRLATPWSHKLACIGS